MGKYTTKLKFRHRRPLTAGLIIVVSFYLAAIFADLIAPYDYRQQTRQQPSAPPSTIHFRDGEGNWHPRPFIYSSRLVDARNMRYEEVTDQAYPLAGFVHGSPYTLLGLIRTDIHLIGVDARGGESTPQLRLLGTDQLGRDRFSRLVFAIRFSLLVAPVGGVLAALIGLSFGAASGYASRQVDAVLMGIADTMISLPTLILILAARAAFPLELPPSAAASLLILIFALTGWAEMACLTRGLVWSMRRCEFVMAARATGVTETRILWRHILPNIAMPLLIQATMMLPVFLIAEISLSFLGVGLQEPEPSLGNMLSAAGDLSQLRAAPFVVLSPAIVIFLFVLGIRLIGWHRGKLRQLTRA